MDARVPARLSAREGRRFGLLVGGAFLALAVLWRAHPVPALAAGTVGGVLLVAGLLVPTHLGPVHRAWMRLALLISRVTTPVFMTLVYLGVIWPVGAVMRLTGHHPLPRPAPGESGWVRRAVTRSDLRRQF